MIDPENMTDEESDAEMMAMYAEYQLHKRNTWDDEAGYELNDPKHPSYYERMAETADFNKKLARGE